MLSLFNAELERLHDDGGDFGAATVDLAILAAIFAIGVRRRLVPLALRNDVAQLVVSQADQQPLRARHERGDRRLKRRIGKIGAWLDRLLKLAIDQLRIKLTWDAGNVQFTEPQVSDLAFDGAFLTSRVGSQRPAERLKIA